MRKKTKKIILFFLIVIALLVGVYFALPEIAEPFLDWMETIDANFPVALLFFTLVFMSCNPFVIGRILFVLGCSFVFRWAALAICYPASVLGAWFWFWACRLLSIRCKWSPDVVFHRFSSKWFMRFKALTNALEHEPTKTTTLLMLSSFPYGILIALLSTTQVPFKSIIVGSLIANIKLVRDVWVSTQAKSVLDAWKGNQSLSTSDSIGVAISVIFSVAAFFAIAFYTNRELKKMEEHPEEVLQQQSALEHEEVKEEEAEEAEEKAEVERRASVRRNSLQARRSSAGGGGGAGALQLPLVHDSVVEGTPVAEAAVPPDPRRLSVEGLGGGVVMGVALQRRSSESLRKIQGVLVAAQAEPRTSSAQLSGSPAPPARASLSLNQTRASSQDQTVHGAEPPSSVPATSAADQDSLDAFTAIASPLSRPGLTTTQS